MTHDLEVGQEKLSESTDQTANLDDECVRSVAKVWISRIISLEDLDDHWNNVPDYEESLKPIEVAWRVSLENSQNCISNCLELLDFNSWLCALFQQASVGPSQF